MILGMEIRTQSGELRNVDDAAFEKLAARMHGDLIGPKDLGYDEARTVFNGMIQRRPASVIRCSGVADVIQAVRFARDNEILVSVRSGGHNVAGSSVAEAGLMIDLRQLREVHVNPRKRLAHVGGGALLRDLDWETQAFGLAVPAGVVSDTGVAGLTLGGGYGWLRAKYGLSIDNLVAADVVTADGDYLHANDTENSDLFWALRGGGGNFGIVTRFTFRAHPVGPKVVFCAPSYPISRARSVASAWREFMEEAPEEFTSVIFLQQLNPDSGTASSIDVICIVGVYAGDVNEGERVIAPLRQLRPLLADESGSKDFVDVQRHLDSPVPTGSMRAYFKSLYTAEFPDSLVETILDAFAVRPAATSAVVIQALRGANQRVSADATAFGDRSANYMIELNSSWPNDRETDRNVAWTRDLFRQLEPHGNGGVYLNHAGDHQETVAHAAATLGDNYERLRVIKKKYDASNFFSLNHNIPPAE